MEFVPISNEQFEKQMNESADKMLQVLDDFVRCNVKDFNAIRNSLKTSDKEAQEKGGELLNTCLNALKEKCL